jgi:hypothetical protein
MSVMKVIKVINPDSAVKLTKEQCISLGIDISQDVIRGEYETVGSWSIIRSFSALCITNEYDKTGMFTKIASTSFFGKRTMSNPRNSGYHLEGRVSIGGKKYSAFTSDILIEVEGKLISVATIHARI